jgi:hypothetical protein
MKKSGNPLDDLFRGSLEEHPVQPSEEGRAAFLREAGALMKSPPFFQRGSTRLLLLLLLLVLTGTGIGIYLYSTKENPVTEKKEQPVTVAENRISNQPALSPATEVTKPIPATTEKTTIRRSENSQTPKSTDETTITKTKSSANITEENISKPSTQPENKPETKPEVKPVAAEPVPVPETKTEEKVSPVNEPVEPATPPDATPPAPPKPVEKAHGWTKPWYFSAGAHYTPEWMFNLAESDAKFVNNFGVDAAFTFDRYSISTGIGLSITKGSNEIAIGTEDYLGTYNQLQDITFVWDSKNYKYIPTISTTPTDVYDTAVTYTYTVVEKQYTYLQVPLILGYDFIMTDKIRFGVRSGPILSLLLNSKQLTTAFDPGKDKVIQINNITPERIQANWQIIAGLSLQYLPSRRFTLEIEPQARYYFNSVYEKSDVTTKPWSAAVRAAVYVNFGK